MFGYISFVYVINTSIFWTGLFSSHFQTLRCMYCMDLLGLSGMIKKVRTRLLLANQRRGIVFLFTPVQDNDNCWLMSVKGHTIQVYHHFVSGSIFTGNSVCEVVSKCANLKSYGRSWSTIFRYGAAIKKGYPSALFIGHRMIFHDWPPTNIWESLYVGNYCWMQPACQLLQGPQVSDEPGFVDILE